MEKLFNLKCQPWKLLKKNLQQAPWTHRSEGFQQNPRTWHSKKKQVTLSN